MPFHSPFIKEVYTQGSHVKSDYAHTILQHTLFSQYILGTSSLISVVAQCLHLPQPHHATASHPSPGDEPQELEWTSERTQKPSNITYDL